ncbi:unnamed protein product [Soboliphyme baturini]|uniref:Protein UBASH3A-like protein n=1 Tax=Soboliphyme baturini TaxID=241478 RepID=A0A183IQZ0_9BILA|nr:unnamed protein product [Soboliphyme baturini]
MNYLQTANPYDTEFSVIDTDIVKKPQNETGKVGPLSAVEEMQHAELMKKASKVVRKLTSRAPGSGRKVFLARHGERIDEVFPGWERTSFTDFWDYKPSDLNMPMTLPSRINGPRDFINDPPLTEFGYVTAQMIGRGARLSEIIFHYVYCSPAFRCIQSAHGFLKAFPETKTKIRIEPGLFEFMADYKNSTLTWMTTEQIVSLGYEIDVAYTPIISRDDIRGRVINQIIDWHEYSPVNILLFTHAAMMDAFSRPLIKRKSLPSMDEMKKMSEYYPYGAVIALEEQAGGRKWQLMPSAMPPISFFNFTNRINFRFFNRS